jgi:hypothetical protein
MKKPWRSLPRSLLWKRPCSGQLALEIIRPQTEANKKLVQVALKTMFRLRKPDKDLIVKIATIDELKQSKFKEWFEAGNS